MALFNFKKAETVKKSPKVKKLEVVKTPKVAKVAKDVSPADTALHADVLLRPRVTEKSAQMAEGSVYVFEVKKGASKHAIGSAFKAFYKVVPEKIHIAKIPAKQVFVRGKKGVKKGGVKAYIYLQKGVKIEMV